MNRLGVSIADVGAGLLDGLDIETLMSHLACAEEASAMDTKGEYAAYCDSLARSLRNMESVFFGDHKGEPRRMKQALREHRKYIANTYGDAWVAMYRNKHQHT